MNQQKIYFTLFLFLLCASCYNRIDQKADNTVLRAIKRNPDLSIVLSHYENQPHKMAAARFLIANMHSYHTFIGPQIDSLKRLKKESILKGRISDEIVAQWKSFDYKKLLKVEDLDVMTVDLLIENIDFAFDAWEKRPWSRHYSFLDFCEYILPYRIGDEPLESWRKVYYERYAPVLDSLYQGSDVAVAACVMADYLKNEGFTNHTDFILPHLGAFFLLENRVGYCRENCDIAIYVMRALGIPVAMDFYPVSPSYNSQHFWTALIDTTHLAIPFNYIETKINRQIGKDERKKGKVYRFFHGAQLEKLSGIYNSSNIPELFKDSLIGDVSSEYFPDSKISITMERQPKDNFGYLSIFTGQELTPIDITKVNKKEADFFYVEPDLIYFPSCMESGKITATGYPFILKEKQAVYFIPDTTDLTTIILKRKYPIRNNLTFFGSACGVKIEGANRIDFKDAKLLYEVTDTPRVNYNIIYPMLQEKFRYIRYSAPENKQIQLGEWYMLNEKNDVPIIPMKIMANHLLDETHEKNLSLMFDGDWSSFYMSAVNGEQLIFDLGKAQQLHSFIFIPRNDDNFIHLGDLYELFYHAGCKGWLSLGLQIAKDTELQYKNVPSGAILWLHNHTRGKEERCFYMKDEKQIFI